jgi:hypothetical protein
VRWSERDPFGHLIVCTEDVWAVKVAKHPEIAAHEAAVRDTIRAPDEVYDDPRSTAQRRPTRGAAVGVQHYYGYNRPLGNYSGHLVQVVVRWRQEAGRPAERYVVTAFLPRSVKPQLVLRWTRTP